MKNTILLFGFRGKKMPNISEQVVNSLSIDTKIILTEHKKEGFHNSIEALLHLVEDQKPTHIVGFGSYSGRDMEYLRIEMLCNAKFRNYIKGEKVPELYIPNFFLESELFKKAYKMGNSWCNFVSFKLCKLIQEKGLNTQFTFIHIPKSMKYELVCTAVKKQLSLLSLDL